MISISWLTLRYYIFSNEVGKRVMNRNIDFWFSSEAGLLIILQKVQPL